MHGQVGALPLFWILPEFSSHSTGGWSSRSSDPLFILSDRGENPAAAHVDGLDSPVAKSLSPDLTTAGVGPSAPFTGPAFPF